MESLSDESAYYSKSKYKARANTPVKTGSQATSNDTHEDSSNLHQYLKEISKLKLLSQEETEQLVIRYQKNGDKKAATELILANLRLVVKVVMDFQKYWMTNFLDLVQEGNVGLTRAVDKYDPSRGVKFSSYAAYWIRAHILKYIMDNWRLVKIGTTQSQRKLFFKLNRERKILEAQGIQPHAELLSKRLDVSEETEATIKVLLEDYRVAQEAQNESMKVVLIDYWDLLTSPVLDEEALAEAEETIANLKSDDLELKSDLAYAIRILLTDEELETLSECFDIDKEEEETDGAEE